MTMRISVVLCTHNGAAHLQRQLRSLLDQQRRPDEVIARDDASTDGTAAILQSFATVAPFPVRLTLNPQPLGTTANFQAAIADATGDVIAPCDQDDVWYPEKLARFEAAMAGVDPPDLVFCDADLIDEQLRPLGCTQWQSIGFTPRHREIAARGKLWSVLARFNVVTGVAMAFNARRRDLLLPIPRGWLHDGWIGLILSAAGKSRMIPQPLLAYRQHANQQIGGGPRTVSGRICAARKMNRDYFLRLGNNFTAAVDRLRQHGITGPAVDLFAQKSDHCRRRADNHLAGICGELFSRRYFSCSLGWQSVAQDLILRRERISPAY
jgi:glycosyltransferase involved in cell wall biosynthesis